MLFAVYQYPFWKQFSVNDIFLNGTEINKYFVINVHLYIYIGSPYCYFKIIWKDSYLYNPLVFYRSISNYNFWHTSLIKFVRPYIWNEDKMKESVLNTKNMRVIFLFAGLKIFFIIKVYRWFDEVCFHTIEDYEISELKATQ